MFLNVFISAPSSSSITVNPKVHIGRFTANSLKRAIWFLLDRKTPHEFLLVLRTVLMITVHGGPWKWFMVRYESRNKLKKKKVVLVDEGCARGYNIDVI